MYSVAPVWERTSVYSVVAPVDLTLWEGSQGTGASVQCCTCVYSVVTVKIFGGGGGRSRFRHLLLVTCVQCCTTCVRLVNTVALFLRWSVHRYTA